MDFLTIISTSKYKNFKNFNSKNFINTPSHSVLRSFRPQHKKKFFSSTYSLNVQTKFFHVTKPDLWGYNKFYERHRSKTYLFDLADHASNTNNIQVTLHTNDKRMA